MVYVTFFISICLYLSYTRDSIFILFRDSLSYVYIPTSIAVRVTIKRDLETEGNVTVYVTFDYFCLYHVLPEMFFALRKVHWLQGIQGCYEAIQPHEAEAEARGHQPIGGRGRGRGHNPRGRGRGLRPRPQPTRPRPRPRPFGQDPSIEILIIITVSN